MKTYYRLRDYYADGTTIELEKFYVVKETPCGVWVKSQYAPPWYSYEDLKKHHYLKWVHNTTTKKHCYPTLKEAIDSFKKRKIRQASILNSQLRQVQTVLDGAKIWENAEISDFKASFLQCSTSGEEISLYCGIEYDKDVEAI